jgi:protein-disulfide isomerase
MKIPLPALYFSMALALSCLGQDETPAQASDPVATVGGETISQQDLTEALGSQWMQLRNQEYELKSKALENLIRQRVVEAEAKRQGVSGQKLLEREADAKVADPSDAEVEAYFWGQNRAGVRFEDVKDQFRTNLKQLRIQKARQAYADSLRAGAEVAILLRPPSVEVAYDRARVKGDPKAPVTIVEFSDFQCPFCRKSEATLADLLAKYKGRIKLAYLDFPLREIHAQAEQAAEAARCAGEQGKFWEYHDSLFADQSKLDAASLAERARNLKLDEGVFRTCLDGGKFKGNVEADIQEGNKAGVAGTPAYFINGVFLSGAQPQAEFEKIIDQALTVRRTIPSIP